MNIFVQIVSYRDPELNSTLRDCLEKAKNPSSLKFGICSQRDTTENLSAFESNPNFKIVSMPWQQSKGLGWARSIAQNLYEGEEYILQIDSHHRFERNWDEILINMLESLDSKKPIISSFAGAYRASNGEKLNIEPYKISCFAFSEEGLPLLRPDNISGWEELSGPIRARFLCGHFLFTRGTFCEYKYDPEIYFEGNDISMSARCYTMGYDLFHPHKNVIWHEYTRQNRSKHWVDHNDDLKSQGLTGLTWWERDEISKKRVKQILKIEDNEINLGGFDLGTERTLREYEIYTGMSFSEKLIQQATISGEEPPKELVSEEEWRQEITGQKIEKKVELLEHSLDVAWSREEIEYADDYQFWFFGFHDDEGKQIYRNDFTLEKNKDILNFKTTEISVSFMSEKEPKSCIIWPYSKSRGWLKRLEVGV